MKLEYYNCPSPVEIHTVKLPEVPEFVKYIPDFELISKLAEEYKNFKNVLVIGHGGSITSFFGIYNALKHLTNKSAYFLSTVDPDYIFELKKSLYKSETLVICISKSGETTTQIEAVSQFADYPLLFITGDGSPLKFIAEKLKARVVTHPVIGGRYTGFTEVNLLPLAICGINVKELYEGALVFYHKYEKDNLAFKTASVLYELEKKGYADVFMPFYSHNLFPMSNVIVQLCHESFGKEGKGQTYFAHEAPESQHHTNQRFFGGIKNICGFFTTVDNFVHSTVNIFPAGIQSVKLKNHNLSEINNIPLQKALEYEWQGTVEDARINSIPLIHMSVESFTPKNLGELLAFWQLFAVYSSVLREVNPFDQPQVENSKNISFNKRLEFKTLL